MSLTILHVGMVGEPGIGITSLTALFEYNRLPTPRLPRCSGLSDVILPASLPLFSKHSTSYPPDSEWSDWRWYRSVPITIQHWLSVEKRQNTGTREIVQIHQEELDVAGDPSVRDHYNGFHAIAICFSVIDRKSFKMVMEKWFPEIRHFQPRLPLLLVGTKTDLRNEHGERRPENADVSYEEGLRLAESIHAEYIECSAVTDRESVERVYQRLSWLALVHCRRPGQKHPIASKSPVQRSPSCVVC